MKKVRLTIAVRMDLQPHALDGRIMELAGELRRLVNSRACDMKSEANRNRVFSDEHREKLSRARRECR